MDLVMRVMYRYDEALDRRLCAEHVNDGGLMSAKDSDR